MRDVSGLSISGSVRRVDKFQTNPVKDCREPRLGLLEKDMADILPATTQGEDEVLLGFGQFERVDVCSEKAAERTARKVYRTRDAARAVDYIERFYNPKRRHSKLGDLSVRSRLIVRPLLEELRLPLVPALEGVVRRPALQDGLR